MAVLTADQIGVLFRQEAEVRLSHLGQLLLGLEHSESAEADIASVFRELHTIKGSSAVAGLTAVSAYAHSLEETVEALRAGRSAVTEEVIDSLLAGVDELAALIGGPANAALPSPPARTSSSPSPTAASLPAAPKSVSTTGAQGVVMVPLERLDELSRLVSESAAAHLRVGRMLSERFAIDPASVPEFNELSRALNELQDRAMRTQMVAVSTVTDILHRAVRDLARAQGKDIRWDARGTDTELDRGVLHQLSDSLLHLVRNAVDHGIETPAEREAAGKPRQATVRLHAMQLGSEVIIAISDDGRGVDLARVREEAGRQGVGTDDLSDADVAALTMRSGLSTSTFVTDVSGRGVGLDVVRANVEAARGRVEVRSEPGQGAEFRVIVPITLAVLRCLLVEAHGHRYALPFHRVVRSQAGAASNEVHVEGRASVWVDGEAVPVSTLTEALGRSEPASSDGPIVVLADVARRHAFRVDRLLGQRDVVLKGLSHMLPNVPAVAGVSVEPDGSVLLVLDPPGLIQRARQLRPPATSSETASGPSTSTRRGNILVVDDALIVRELQRSILERVGFSVRVASDGVQALAMLADSPSDLVLTDVEMPRLDGFGLTEAIRADQLTATIPVLIISSRATDADRQRGLAAGADGYIVKSGFDEGALLAAVDRLLGGRL